VKKEKSQMMVRKEQYAVLMQKGCCSARAVAQRRCCIVQVRGQSGWRVAFWRVVMLPNWESCISNLDSIAKLAGTSI